MRRREEYDEDEALDQDDDDDDDEEYDGGRKSSKKRPRKSEFIDDAAEEDDEEDDDDEDYGSGNGKRWKKKVRAGAQFFDIEAEVSDYEEEEDEEEADDDFIVDSRADLRDEEDTRRMHRHPLLHRDDDQEEDIEALERRLHERYGKREVEYDEEATDVEQQALLPSVRDTKLWMVKCVMGREREVAVCLMQKFRDKGSELQIRSAIALDHLKNYIYVEAHKEAHVREAVKGMRNIYSTTIHLVPIKEMTDVLSVESKAVDLSRDTWVRIKIGTYKGDLAMVVDVDNLRRKVTVKLIPRIDLQALANKLEGREVQKKKAFTPPPRFMNIEEVREMHIRVERRRDPNTGDYFENIGGMMFKHGFLYKTVSMKSISSLNIEPTFDELEKFRQPAENGDVDMANLSTLFVNRKKVHFMKGDQVIVVKGDLKNLKGTVEKVEEDIVHIKPHEKGLMETLEVSDKDLCKYFEPGNHVKVVAGPTEGATGIVVSVEGHVVNTVSDATRKLLQVFADNVVESSEVTTGMTQIGDYELHDLVQLDDMSFGVIIRVENEAFQVLKGLPEKAEVVLVRLREIKFKIDRKVNSLDRRGNKLAVKDIVKILEGPGKGKQGPLRHIYRGILFVYDRHHLEHTGFICAKSESCMLIGGSHVNGDRNGRLLLPKHSSIRTPTCTPSPMRSSRCGPPMNSGERFRGGRGCDNLVGQSVKIRQGPHKGCKGRVKEVKGNTLRVELEAQMRVVTVNCDQVTDGINVSTPYRGYSRFAPGAETPIHPSQTPLHPYMTPMRDSGATPIHDGMRTPMRDRAWNPYTPRSFPLSENWFLRNHSPPYDSPSVGS